MGIELAQKMVQLINTYNQNKDYELSDTLVGQGATAKIYCLKNADQIVKIVDVHNDKTRDLESRLGSREEVLSFRLREIESLFRFRHCSQITKIYDAYEILEQDNELVVSRKLDENTDYTQEIDYRVVYYVLFQKYYMPLKTFLYTTPITEVDIFDLLQDMLKALMALQEKNILHSDIKIENVFVETTGTKLRYVLGDLGFATYIQPGRRTKVLAIAAGNECYPPEFRNRKEGNLVEVDGYQSDIYLLGRMIIKIYGSVVVEDDDDYGIAQNLMAAEGRAQNLIGFEPQLIATEDGNLQYRRILEKAVRKEKAQRYVSAAEMYGDLKQIDKIHRPYRIPFALNADMADAVHVICGAAEEKGLTKKREKRTPKDICESLTYEVSSEDMDAQQLQACKVVILHMKQLNKEEPYTYTEEEVAFLRDAAEHKNPEAMYLYAQYCWGRKQAPNSSDENYRTCLKYMKEAANWEYPEACNWYNSFLYNQGKIYESLDWLLKAVLREHEPSVRRMRRLLSGMTAFEPKIQEKLCYCQRLMREHGIWEGTIIG